MASTTTDANLRQQCYNALMEPDPQQKCHLVAAIAQQTFNAPTEPAKQTQEFTTPGRPNKPLLVAPRKVKKRGLAKQSGRNYFMHALPHIEFNAINLALDAAFRFDQQPQQFYLDWLFIAADEARHFLLVCDYLTEHGVAYGDYPAHDGLWDMCLRTADDIVARMALVPRVLEARGLDVSPTLIDKLAQHGDQAAVDILQVIYTDEIEHVRLGSKWFAHQCTIRQLDPQITFFDCIEKHMHGELRGPFNLAAREMAGFSQQELENIQNKYG